MASGIVDAIVRVSLQSNIRANQAQTLHWLVTFRTGLDQNLSGESALPHIKAYCCMNYTNATCQNGICVAER